MKVNSMSAKAWLSSNCSSLAMRASSSAILSGAVGAAIITGEDEGGFTTGAAACAPITEHTLTRATAILRAEVHHFAIR